MSTTLPTTDATERDPFSELDQALSTSREFSRLILAAVEARDAAEIDRLRIGSAEASERVDALLRETSEILAAQAAARRILARHQQRR